MGWTYEQKKIWNAANPEKVKEYGRRYRTKHAAQISRQHKKYYRKNKEDLLEKQRIYRSFHPEYQHKHDSFVNKRVDAQACFMEYYEHNIILAELDIQCQYRTMIERKVFE